MASDGLAISSGAAKRYAAALYSFSEDQNRLGAVTANMQRLGDVIDGSPDLGRALKSPLTDVKDAERAMFTLIKAGELGMGARRLIKVLATNRRLPLLRDVVAAFAALVADKRGVTTALAVSAHPLSDVQEQQLRARLIELGHGNVRIERHVDPALLGGFTLRVGARLYDASLKSRVQRLQYAIKGAA